MSNPKHLPPQALDAWLAEAAEHLELDSDLVSIATVLNVAKEVAHGVARPAAPLTTFLLGMAIARTDDPRAALAELAPQINDLARAWDGTDLGGSPADTQP